MKRVGLALCVLTAAIAATAILSVSGSAQTPGERTIKLFESDKGSSFGFIDNPPIAKNKRNPRLSAGDMLVFSSPVYDEARTQKLGSFDAHCSATRPGTQKTTTLVCTGVVGLTDGTITLAARIVGSPTNVTAAVTGGTGAYTGARGTYVSKNVKGGSTDTITLMP
jgi:hypothetical protein